MFRDEMRSLFFHTFHFSLSHVLRAFDIRLNEFQCNFRFILFHVQALITFFLNLLF